ncbi:LAME_0H05952g1_1 [Lachancea meyersii CBS 8951]|uniref:Chromatin modification-related protein EAF7 n=1 Tax=Lachancea meyersii CBS 8951 TaxID=1266667 RepID=A0A1G4KEJ4_9SACH|nr:LAME_0H05952g1_1 [Lachancea meyersii CBS 8951]
MSEPWSIEDDIRLFRWITDFKPAGIHKHFHMISILGRMNRPDQFPVVLLFDKLKSEGKGQFIASEIWAKLDQHYDLAKLDERENLAMHENEQVGDSKNGEKMEPFHSSASQALRRAFKGQREFNLPWDEYGELILENARSALDDNPEDEEHRSDQNFDREAVHRERSPRRLTRSSISHRPQKRVTRSQGPAPLPRDTDELANEDSVRSEKGSQSGSEADQDTKNSPEGSGIAIMEGEEYDPRAHEVEPEKQESQQEGTDLEPVAPSAQHEAPTQESPPSKRTRTTRSHPADAISEINDAGKDRASMAPSLLPQAQQAVRTSSRVANRRKSRR